MPLIYLDIDYSPERSAEDTVHEDPLPMFVLEEFARRITTLHFLAVASHDEVGASRRDYWQIIRSKSPGGRLQLRKLPAPQGEEVAKRLWDLDRGSLTNFDIEGFMARP